MSFDKVKAMRNAERFLAQGKLRAAISEYKRVVEFDKIDFNTLNMLGDLYVKAAEPDEAVNCFTQVAEHYAKQGFAQKAIAIYNKISRLKPDSMEVAAKLAHLYQMKGSFAEAKTHYTTLAEQYSRTGKKAEALNAWKQIASLDPNNTDIYLKIADACWQDQQKEEAANAYIEAGNRLNNKSQFESAITAYSRALEIRPDDLPALRGYVKSQIGLGYADEAAKSLESSLNRQPNSREIINLLADCYIEAGNHKEAEKTIVLLVEKEPTHYPKLLEIFQAYLKIKDISSATRMLTMASEHMLVGGRALELEQKINEVLSYDPEDLDAIRLLVRFNNWQRDENGIKVSMERLAEAAKINNAVEDERYALSQLVLLAPQNIYFAQRLQELNLANGYNQSFYSNSTSNNGSEVPTFESFQVLGNEEEPVEYKGDFEFVSDNDAEVNETGFAFGDQDSFEENSVYPSTNNNFEIDNQLASDEVRALSEYEKHSLQREIEGIDFYIEQGYFDLAEKTIDEIEERYGSQPIILELRQLLNSKTPSVSKPEEIEIEEDQENSPVNSNDFQSDFSEENNFQTSDESLSETKEELIENLPEQEMFSDKSDQTVEADFSEFNGSSEEFIDKEESFSNQDIETESSFSTPIEESEISFGEEQFTNEVTEPEAQTDYLVEENKPSEVVETQIESQNEEAEKETPVEIEKNQEVANQPNNQFAAMQSELAEETKNVPSVLNAGNETYDDDFETSYQTGIVYREMGLIEDSIREFQDAIKRVTPLDGTRRYFLCCNMLGLCFMEKEMPTIAIMWFKQGLDSNHLSQFEINGMRYELANAYEKAGDNQKARQVFEEIYAVDVSFRDVGNRLMALLRS